MIYERDGNQVTTINWIAPTERTDGTAYGAADHAGYELGVGASGIYEPWVSVPAAYDITSWPLDQLNMNDEGQYEVVMRTVDKGGRVSDWSSSINFIVSIANPRAPTGLETL